MTDKEIQKKKDKLSYYAGQAAATYPDQKEDIWAKHDEGLKELDKENK